MSHSVRTPDPKRITLNNLKDWVNLEFKRLGMPEYECYEVVRTRFTSDQYESGATKMYIKLKRADMAAHPLLNSCTIFCFYSIAEIKDHLKFGWHLCLRQSKPGQKLTSVTQLELDLVK